MSEEVFNCIELTTLLTIEQCFSTFFNLYQYLAASLDGKIGLKVYKSDNWWHPRYYLIAPRLRTTDIEGKIEDFGLTRFFPTFSRLLRQVSFVKYSAEKLLPVRTLLVAMHINNYL